MIDDDTRALRNARVTAGAAYLLGGVLVAAVAVCTREVTTVSLTWLIAAAIRFTTMATVAKRLRQLIPNRVVLESPSWRDLWPHGFATAPLFTGTAVLGLYAVVSSATSMMATRPGPAVFAASVAIASLTLHVFVPEVAIKRRDDHGAPVPRVED
ncbi:hypothetical protein AB0O16_03560 [Microbacterium sp. NPDC089180]|uniref:hypothetical protein n=1 Tax=unclassified Microbacterium TaxID=2609290 RepID=UPI0034460CD6